MHGEQLNGDCDENRSTCLHHTYLPETVTPSEEKCGAVFGDWICTTREKWHGHNSLCQLNHPPDRFCHPFGYRPDPPKVDVEPADCAVPIYGKPCNLSRHFQVHEQGSTHYHHDYVPPKVEPKPAFWLVYDPVSQFSLEMPTEEDARATAEEMACDDPTRRCFILPATTYVTAEPQKTTWHTGE